MSEILRIGLDIGSTTIKCVVLDEKDKIIYSCYERHLSLIAQKTRELTRLDNEVVHGAPVRLSISGSAGMGFGWRAGSGAFSGVAFRAGTCTGEASAADKYAAHERVLFEKLKSETHPVMPQLLLQPVPVQLTKPEAQAVLDNLPLLQSLGFDVSEFSDWQLVLRQVPADLSPDDACGSLGSVCQPALIAALHAMVCSSSSRAPAGSARCKSSFRASSSSVAAASSARM